MGHRRLLRAISVMICACLLSADLLGLTVKWPNKDHTCDCLFL